MKTLVKTLVLIIAINFSFAIFPKQASAQHAYVSFRIFYDQLGPFGTWVAYPHYGYVWVPNVGPDFVPYSTDGYWVLTDNGWTWVSDYSWGWAPFHYGRWDYDNYYGWFWVPDNEWGPAWVVWRRAEGYYGWAPMKPGISINLVFGRGYQIPHEHWVFVRDRDFERHDISHHYMGREQNVTIINNSKIIHNTYVDKGKRSNYFYGPDRKEIEHVSGKPVRRMSVDIVDKPERRNVGNNRVEIYKPHVQKQTGEQPKYTPKPLERWQKQSGGQEKNISNRRSENQVNSGNRNQSTQQKNYNPSENRTEGKSKSANTNNDKKKEQSQSSPNRRR
jgi:hypothetical protein